MQLVRRTRDYAVGSQDRFLVFVWRHNTTAVEIAYGVGMMAELASRYPHGVHLMQVIEESAVLPDAETRAAISTMLREAADYVAFSSVTHEGGGFRGSVIRSIVTGLLMLHKPVFPHIVFDTAEHALEKHAATLGVSPNDPLIRGVAQAVNEVRAAIISG